jgi:hypothetical protein
VPEWITPDSGLPTAHAIRSKFPEGQRFPDGMPLGGWGNGPDGLAHAVTDLREWAENLKTGDGGFGLVKIGRLAPATRKGKKGARRSLQCICRGEPPGTKPDAVRSKPSVKCGCPFYMTLEESNTGWVVSHMHKDSVALETFHNHILQTSQAAANAAPGGALRSIPVDLMQLGAFMAKHHISPGKIYSSLARECQDKGDDVTFTQNDVRNAFAASVIECALDATGMVELLEKRKLTQGLQYEILAEEGEGLTRVFFEFKGGRELWERSRGKVVILDSKHGTQRYGLKLACLVTVDRNGVTQILGASLLRHEDAPSFKWVSVVYSARAVISAYLGYVTLTSPISHCDAAYVSDTSDNGIFTGAGALRKIPRLAA